MFVEIKLSFFESFPPDKVQQFMECLKEVQEKEMKYGKIELSVSEGRIIRVTQSKHFEK